ncbi:hypothetical protein HC251_15540 [Iamia sp. SCSIO 61187]|uniref:transposase n=1 Tax=Iamia sp. SCSIO 61187 TaxID=2722752 RepID=UPI001C62A0CD|nr:transposase [Iamia sp. SCSIO 61187]QYG93697.1 hypothetical protein HC251_15540 [Iamia sp. SCSIO 61187]
MGRPHRRESETGIHHVMNRGVDHQPIFRTDADRIELGERLSDIHGRFDVVTLAYCLMGNHLHLVLRAPAGVLPEAMHHLTSVYSRRFNARHGRDGPLFNGRYRSIPVETDGYLLWVTRYVHRNPLDIAGIRSPREYRWSSYRAYLGLRPAPTFLDVRPVLDLVGGPEELASLTEGDGRAPLRGTGDVTQLVRCGLAVADLATSDADRPAAKVERTLLVLLAERSDDPELRRAVAAQLGPRRPEAAREAVRRAEARRLDDPTVAWTLEWVEQQLATAS